uniref:Putative secreted protein n=1 Tax=Ixodes ricinus TaxID=34613 RepID=A0A6B0U1P5_IXORI
MSWVAARKLSATKTTVSSRMSGALAPSLLSPSRALAWLDSQKRNRPMAYWVGTSHDLRRPNDDEYIESTMGAQSSFTLNGHVTKLNRACSL